MNFQKIFASILIIAVALTSPGPCINRVFAQQENAEVASLIPETVGETLLGSFPELHTVNSPQLKAPAAPLPGEPLRKITPTPHASQPLEGFFRAPADMPKSKFSRALNASRDAVARVNEQLLMPEAGSGETEGSGREPLTDAHRRWSRFYDFGGVISDGDSSPLEKNSKSASGQSSGSAAAARLATKTGNGGSDGYLVPDPILPFREALKAAKKKIEDPHLTLIFATYQHASNMWSFSFYSNLRNLQIKIPISQSRVVLWSRIEEITTYNSGYGFDPENLIPLSRIIDFNSHQWKDDREIEGVKMYKTPSDLAVKYEFAFDKNRMTMKNAESFQDVGQLIERDLQELRKKLTSLGVAVKDIFASANEVVVSMNTSKDEKIAREYLADAVRWKLLFEGNKIIVNSDDSLKPKPELVRLSMEGPAPLWTEKDLRQFVAGFGPTIKESAPELIVDVGVASEISGLKLPKGPTIVIWTAKGARPQEVQSIVENRVPAAKPIPGRPLIYWPRPF